MYWQAPELIDSLAAQERTALIFVDEYGHRRDYTFGEIARHSRRYAAVLRAFGVQRDDRVYVCLSVTAKCIFTLLGLQRLGARAILDDSQADGAAAVVAGRKSRARLDEMRDRFSADARYLIIGEERDGWARLDTLAQVAADSTIAPEAGGDEAALEQARAAAREQLAGGAADVVWCATPADEAAWFERAVMLPWLCSSATVAHDAAFDPLERMDLLRELDVTIVLQRAQEYRDELALPQPARFKLPRLRRCIVLDDADAELQTAWTERFGLPLASIAAMPPSVFT